MLDNGVLHCKWETPAADDALATVKDARCGQKYYMFLIIALTRACKIKMSGGFSSNFELVPQKCVSHMLQPAEKPPFDGLPVCYS